MSHIEVATIELGDEDNAFITDLTERFPEELALGHEAQAADWVERQMALAEPNLPLGLNKLANTFTDRTPVILISQTPSEDLPPTPVAYQTPERAEVYSFDIAQLALTSLGGSVYGNRHVRAGRILADVFPKPDYTGKTDTAFGSGETFDFHADGAVHYDTTPNLFSLHCIRNSEQAPTFFSSVSWGDFDPDTFTALREPVFTIYYEAERTGTALKNTPIIEKEASGKFRLNYYGKDKVAGPDDSYDEVLDNFDKALQANVQEVTLQPGDIVFVDNRHVQHGRRAFQAASPPEYRRWLRRVFAAWDTPLVSRIAASGDRILDSTHAS